MLNYDNSLCLEVNYNASSIPYIHQYIIIIIIIKNYNVYKSYILLEIRADTNAYSCNYDCI